MNMYDFPKEGRSQLACMHAVGVVIKLVGLAVVVVVGLVGH